METVKYFDRMYFLEEKISKEDYKLMERKIQDFISMCYTKRFSPIEQIMILYDRVKLFSYKDNEDPNVVRRLSDVIINEEGVCAGYVNVFHECLYRMGFKCSPIVIKFNIPHACEIIEVNDDKYNIHGIYIFDPTSDSLPIDSKIDRSQYYTFFAKTINELYDSKKKFQFDTATTFLFKYSSTDLNISNEMPPSFFFKIVQGFYPYDIPDDIVKKNWDVIQYKENWKKINHDLIKNKIEPISKIIEKTATIPLYTLLEIIRNVRTSENPEFSEEDMKRIFACSEANRQLFFKDSFEDYNRKKNTNTYNEGNNQLDR